MTNKELGDDYQRTGSILRYKRPPWPYEAYMEEEGIPIVRGMGVRDVRELELKPWERMGGRGSYMQLDGTGNRWGSYVVEIPPRGSLNPERHFCEEMFLVVEGRGSTEVWRDGSSRRNTFEWEAGSLFSVPINLWHTLVNAGSSPALVYVMSSMPSVMNMFPNRSFIFDNPFEFTDRYDEQDEYFRPTAEIEPHPIRHTGLLRTNMVPDITTVELPLLNERAPGHRHVQFDMAGNTSLGAGGLPYIFLNQYPPGRYTKAHAHGAGAILFCARGQGYSYSWDKTLGPRPWDTGQGHLVRRQDYVAGGMVSAAPGGSEAYHQHFGVSKDTFRQLAIHGGFKPVFGQPGDDMTQSNEDMDRGGTSVPYHQEDPHIRKAFEELLAEEGVAFDMDESLYQPRD